MESNLKKGRNVHTRAVLLMTMLAAVPAVSIADGSPGKPHPSGVSGIVSLKPGCPGPQKKDDDCHKPLPDKPVQLIDAAGKVITSAMTDVNGKFTLHAKPGKYSLKVAIDALYPRCPTVEVRVRKRGLTEADVQCDSGMR